ncbi:MAG: ComF family protein [Dysgonamonadaceae bacterium]|jgi:ComF family protein|nr:ComF family protein [Dysgonamonadaceae bacterium]
MKIKNSFQNFFRLFYPELCVGCSQSLIENEKHLCMECFSELPKTFYHLSKSNSAYEQLAGKFPLEKAASFLFYNKNGLGQKLIAELKYRGNIYVGQWLGEYLAKETLDFFTSIDLIIPVPLHKSKLKLRGFNQTEIIAAGISKITHIPIDTSILYREKANISQTTKGAFDRWKNTSGIFNIKNAQTLQGKHVLLIDDVLTTGSTLEACAHALLKAKSVKISILTLGITRIV